MADPSEEASDPSGRIAELSELCEVQAETIIRLEAENQLWRELVAEFREAAVPLAPVIWHSKGTERVRRCMADPRFLRRQVDVIVKERLAEQKAREEAEGEVTGEADEG